MKSWKRTARGACSVLALASIIGLGANAQELKQTPWEVHEGKGVFDLGKAVSNKGTPDAFVKATIPAADDAGWSKASESGIVNNDGSKLNDATIGMSRASIIDSSKTCMTVADYTYFQTFVDVPAGTKVTDFKIAFEGMDDSSRVTIFNKSHPNGTIDDRSYVAYRASGSSDLGDLVTDGRNRVVITQVDNCAPGNDLKSATVVLNGETLPAEEEPTKPVSNNSHGDVHIDTPDGLRYDFQAVGDFILAARNGGKDPLVVARQTSLNPAVSVNTAVAFMVDGDVLEFRAKPNKLLINGKPAELKAQTLPKGGTIKLNRANDVEVYWKDKKFGARAIMLSNGHLDIGAVNLGGPAVTGVLGNQNGNSKDDMQIRDGRTLQFPPSAAELAEFGDSWRMGKNVFSTAHPEAPAKSDALVAGAKLSNAERAEGEKACKAGGVTGGIALDDCAYDVAATGDKGFIESAKGYQEDLKVNERPQPVSAEAEPVVTLEQVKKVPAGANIRNLSDLMDYINKDQASNTDSIYPLTGEFSFERGKKYYSQDGGHYAIFQDDGNFVVYTKQDRFVWGLNLVTDKFGQIAVVRNQADGNLAAYDANNGWIWSARNVVSPNGSQLKLQPNGALEIVAPSGEVLWSSKK